jgi:hypothetical protein
MADYKKMRNSCSGYHGSFPERMVEETKKSLTNTYPLMLYLHGFLEANQSDTCMSYLPSDVFCEITSVAPCSTVQKKGGGQTPSSR